MPSNQPDKSDETTAGGQLVEFVDRAHEVTDEERNRPRFGRPERKPLAEESTRTDTSNSAQPPK